MARETYMPQQIGTQEVTERDIELFQICPAYRKYKLEDKDFGRKISLDKLHNHLVIRQSRWLFSNYLKTGHISKLSSVKINFSTYALKVAQKNRIEDDVISEYIVEGGIVIKSIYNNISEDGLKIVSARIPLTHTTNGIVLRTYPEAIFVGPDQKVYTITFSDTFHDKRLVNNLVNRFRIFVVSNKLNQDIIVRNYSLTDGKVKDYPSEILNNKQLPKDLTSIVTAISNNYSVPNDQRTCFDECPYKRKCYY